MDGEIKEEGANDVETVGEGLSNSEHQDSVDERPSDGPSDGEEKILLYLYLTGSTKILKYI